MVIIGMKQINNPPPQIIPISWIPLKSVKYIATNAPAVVNAPVRMPWPV